MSDNADLLVVGGGVIGLSCAWRVAQRGRRVILVDRHYCGYGASGASLGVLMPAPATRHGPSQTFQRHSLQLFPALAAELREITGDDIGYRRCGMIEVLRNDARRTQALKEVELACAEWPADDDRPVMKVLSNEEAAALEPSIEFDACGARLCRSSARVDVARYLAGLRRACEQAGVDVREGVDVTGIRIERGRVRGAVCGAQLFPADAVLVATGAWTAQLGEPIASAVPVRPAKGQALTLRCAGVLPARMVKRHGTYLVPRQGDEIFVGATSEPEAGFDDRPSAGAIATLVAGALAISPALADAHFVETWAGIRPESIAQYPFLGSVPGVDGLYVAAGHYKTGIGLSAATGRLMAELIVDGASTLDLSAFAPLSA